jgi:hypothetical protein
VNPVDIKTAAFDAAYAALQPHTQHAQIRGEIAQQVADELAEWRSLRGPAWFAQLAEDGARRNPVVTIVTGNIASGTNSTRRLVDIAVAAAAAKFAEES